MDCSITPTRIDGVFNVQTTDYFYPLVDDPYLQGRIACANVLSDLYAMGVSECDGMLMILAASRLMTKEDRNIVTGQLIKGFNDLAVEAGTKVTGGQTVLNPWPIIGGVATAICREEDFIRPVAGVAGDVIVLTKPLGTQVAVNVHQWLTDEARWAVVEPVITRDAALVAYNKASDSMARLNRTGAALMRKYGAHAATDVTGFGIKGHADNLASNQEAPVDLVINTLPVIAGMAAVNGVFDFGLTRGTSAETSGGLLVLLPSREAAVSFIADITEADGAPAWIIGSVVEGENKCVFAEDMEIIEV